MTTSQPNLLELAKKGDVTAISTLMGERLHPRGITAKLTSKENCLQIMLEAEQVPNQQELFTFIQKELTHLKAESIHKVKLYGRQTGEDFPDWQQEFEVVTQPATQPSFWGAMFGAVASTAETVGSAAVQAGNTVVGTAFSAGETVGNTLAQTSGALTGAVVGTAEALGGATAQAGQAVAGAAVSVGEALASTAMHAPGSVGYLVNFISTSPQLQELSRTLQVDWLVKLIEQVDIVKAEAHVKRLQKHYPNEKPNEIAHRVMLEKALYVGGTGFASSLVPGFAAALFAVDLAATMALQAEMIYQIAAAYGLDLHHQERKGEVLAIFGLALGGNTAIKAGLGFARNIPGAGAVIGASSNAAMLYGLGYGACQFYEAKLSSLNAQAALQASQAKSEKFLQEAVAQEVLMDQILTHVILAGQPKKIGRKILPRLAALKFSPASMEVIATNIESLPTLETLFNQVDRDFSVPLLAQCQKIAFSDGVVTPEEVRVLEMITQKLGSAS